MINVSGVSYQFENFILYLTENSFFTTSNGVDWVRGKLPDINRTQSFTLDMHNKPLDCLYLLIMNIGMLLT